MQARLPHVLALLLRGSSQCVFMLKLDQQQVITLALEGMSYQEIADVLVITTNHVGVRLQRAKTALAQLLEAV